MEYRQFIEIDVTYIDRQFREFGVIPANSQVDIGDIYKSTQSSRN